MAESITVRIVEDVVTVSGAPCLLADTCGVVVSMDSQAEKLPGVVKIAGETYIKASLDG